jgi:hypothetical protein
MIYYSGKELPLELMIKAGICHVFLGNIEKAEVCCFRISNVEFYHYNPKPL